MIRKLVLALVILAMAAMPLPALAPYPYYAYAPPACYWQPGYSVNQPYVDAWGRYTYVQQWVPAQYVCY